MSACLNIKALPKQPFTPELLKFKSISSDQLDKASRECTSFWTRRALKMELADRIKGVFKEHTLDLVRQRAKTKEHGEACCKAIESQWDEVYKRLRLNSGVQHPTDVMQTETFLKMGEELKDLILAIEPRGFDLVDSQVHKEESVQLHILRSLVSSLPLFDTRLMDKTLLYHMFFSCDEQYISEMRDAFKSVFDRFHSCLSNKEEVHDDLVIEMVRDHLLSMYVFTEPKNGDVIHIPQSIEGKVENVSYRLERIPLVAPDEYRTSIDAYAFEPIDVKAPPYLVFRGTTFPSAPGSLLGYTSDFIHNKAVGEWLFEKGEDKIRKQILKMHQKHGEVLVSGLSLGGSLAQLTARLEPDKTSCRAVAPAGVLPSQVDNFDKVQGIAYAHPHCPVHRYIGFIPRGKDYRRIEVLEKDKRGIYDAHVSLYGVRPSILLKIKPVEENTRTIRKIGTVMHRTASFFIAPFCKGALFLGKAIKW